MVDVSSASGFRISLLWRDGSKQQERKRQQPCSEPVLLVIASLSIINATPQRSHPYLDDVCAYCSRSPSLNAHQWAERKRLLLFCRFDLRLARLL